MARGIIPGRYLRSRCRCSCPAVHTKTHSLLRSSSTHEPSDPPLRVSGVTVWQHEVANTSVCRRCVVLPHSNRFHTTVLLACRSRNSTASWCHAPTNRAASNPLPVRNGSPALPMANVRGATECQVVLSPFPQPVAA